MHTTQHTIRFVKEAHAKAFVADLPRWDPKVTDVVRKGKTVTLTAPLETSDGQPYVWDLREFVGYHGAPPQGPVATVNGHRVPRCY